VRRPLRPRAVLAGALALGLAAPAPASTEPGAPGPTAPLTFHPPPESAMPKGPLGEAVRLGEEIFRHTGEAAPQFVGNALTCSNCHLDAGRLANASPLWAGYVSFPAYRAKDRRVNTFAERLQGCFRFSMNGTAPPLGDQALVALESYAFWLSQGAPVGESLPGRGYPPLPKPAAAPDFARGGQVYAQRCALCHGADGGGQPSGGTMVFPPVWGARSYNGGAGMASVATAAAFMPLGLGGSLSDQDAWDVALFVDGHERPQDPRFTGSVQETRARFHDSPDSFYGLTVNGVLLGQGIGQ
jgi:thiosulfate dehydrogenase